MIDDAGFTPIDEAAGLLPQSQERPADVAVIDFMESNHHLALDVSCHRVITNSSLEAESARPGTTLEAAEDIKRAQYTARCAERSITFVPIIMDEFGRMGPHGAAFIDQLAWMTARRRVAARRTAAGAGAEASTLRRRWRGFFTAELHGAVARTVLYHSTRATQGIHRTT